MKMPPRYVLISAGAVAMLMVFWFAADAWIWKPAAAIEKRIDSANASLERRMRDLDNLDALEARLSVVTSSTLGASTEVVDLELRSRLATLAETAGVRDLRVSTSAPEVVGTPGRSAFRSSAVRDLRDEPDFVLVPATLTAEGSWSQVTALIDAIRAQPWPARIRRLRLANRDNGKRIEASIQLDTLFVPGALPDGGEERPVKLAVRLGETNPFAPPYVPPPVPLPEPETVQPRPRVTWRIVHIGQVEGHPEVLLVSHKGARRRMVQGDVIAGFTLLGVDQDGDGYDVARFGKTGGSVGESWVLEAGSQIHHP